MRKIPFSPNWNQSFLWLTRCKEGVSRLFRAALAEKEIAYERNLALLHG